VSGVGSDIPSVASSPETRNPKPETRRLSYHTGDAMRLPLADASVDVVSIAFGIRNVAQPERAVREFFRVLKPGGRIIILEFSLPTNPVLRGLYNFYFRHIMPRTATLIARDRSGAYKYLPRSVNTFINRETVTAMIKDAGFVEPAQKAVTFGVAVIYRGVKR
jgi:demethylmenaquinone methyltransferase/2-methoxy-6-polyprenyl-1,4-benzoquinol methylase